MNNLNVRLHAWLRHLADAKEDDKIWQKRAYRSAADTILSMEDITESYDFRSIHGVGNSIHGSIMKYINMGDKAPDLTNVGGKVYYTVNEHITEFVNKIVSDLRLLNVNADIAGSLRRGNSKVHDLDLITDASPSQVRDYINFREDLTLLNGGDKYIRFVANDESIPPLDIRIADPNLNHYGALLLHFTGPMGFNIKLRQHANRLGYSLSEYGLAKLSGEDNVLFTDWSTEEKVFDALGLNYLQPSER